MIIKHKFLDHVVSPDTEILILGTFNPEKQGNEAEFFYGRRRNFLWTILSECYGVQNLKNRTTGDKIAFARQRKIDFIDLVKSANYEKEDVNYDDVALDGKVREWNNVKELILKLPALKKVALTRKTLRNIPNMSNEILKIEKICKERNIDFACLVTPSRFCNDKKVKEYKDFLKI